MIIGISGPIGSGKTVITKHLKEKHGFIEYNFANPLKEIGTTLGFTESELYGSQEDKLKINKTWGISGREFMQKFGTEVFRNTLPNILPTFKDVWIKLFEKFVHDTQNTFISLNHQFNIVVGDVRFEDEAVAIRKLGGIIIRIERDNINTIHSSKHSSENGCSADLIIKNDKDLEYLFKQIDNYVDLYV
jgi:pantothenate kinase-related protein Tda10